MCIRDREGVHLLLVDDDPAALGAARRLCRRLGCRVTAVSAGREALAILTGERRVDILVTDVVMTEMSGFTLVDLASRARPDLPALYISGYPQEEAYWGGTPGARTAFLAKPLDLAELGTTLLSLLSPAGSEAV